MTASAEIERKVRQLDNDVQAIYELLGAIQGTQKWHGRRLDELTAGQARLLTGQAELTAGQAEMATRQVEMAAGLAEMGARQAEMGAGQAEQGAKLDAILALLQNRSG